jgi:ATP-dependent DNA helicase RecG
LVPLLLPARYQDLTNPVTNLISLFDGERIVIKADVKHSPSVSFKNKPPRLTCTLTDHNIDLQLVAFGDTRDLEKRLVVGTPVLVRGTIKSWQGQLQIASPELIDNEWLGRVRPVYTGKKGVIGPDLIRTRVLSLLDETLAECVAYVRERLGIEDNAEPGLLQQLESPCPTLSEIIYFAHRPRSMDEGEACLRTLDRIAAYILLKEAKASEFKPDVQAPIWISKAHTDVLKPALPFPLTQEQEQAVDEIIQDLRSPTPMMRLLSGDVGTGKTAVYALSAAAAILAGKKVAILLPGLPLAKQVAQNIASWWPDIRQALVTGDDVADLDASLLIGTTALLHRLEEGHLDYVIVDEQQRFSREQREQLVAHGANLLEVTGTPIPRTMALLQYTGMKVSRLAECHVKKEIVTTLFRPDDRKTVFERVKATVKAGSQVLVIYPLAEHEDGKDKKSAEGAFELWNRHFPNLVSFVHGKLSGAEKHQAIEDLRQNRSQILIATTVVEVGIDLPELKHILVVHPERLGLVSLHQLRGRVARKGGTGYCDLFLPEDVGEKSIDRLNVLVRHKDGLSVATQDMLLRGFGDLNGVEQSGSSISILIQRSINLTEIEFVLGI